jgi:hypothetical protein
MNQLQALAMNEGAISGFETSFLPSHKRIESDFNGRETFL